MENIRDFIVLHYITKKNNSKFWSDIQNVELPESLKNNLEVWQNKMPIGEDFKNQSGYSMFWADNFILIMHGLKMFNVNSIKKEYDSLSENAKFLAEQTISNELLKDQQINLISHKEYIRITREIL